MHKKLKLQSTIENYNQLHEKGTSQFTPRIGYYFIQKVEKRLVPNHPTPIDVATALWKQFKEEEFQQQLSVTIQLKTFEMNPHAGSSNALKDVEGKIIHVRKIYVDRTNPLDRRIVCNWEIIPEKEADENIDYIQQNAMDVAEDEIAETELSLMEIDNALLDMYDYEEQWDNYEANLYLDLEENAKRKEELNKKAN